MTGLHWDGPLALDFSRIYPSLGPGGRRRPFKVFGFVLTNSEFHCVACYRLGQYADRVASRSASVGAVLRIVHRIWNRFITHSHHCEVTGQARIGPGFLIMHRTGILIGPATIGKNLVLHHNVTIGQRVAGGDHGVPGIGDNVWIGPGATITGAITIGDGATISAGTVLSRSVPPRALVGGVPGRIMALDYDNSAMLGRVVP